MEITDDRIDAGRAFDWGRTSEEYAKYRDIYPNEFYNKIIDRGLCIEGQKVLDLGTGAQHDFGPRRQRALQRGGPGLGHRQQHQPARKSIHRLYRLQYQPPPCIFRW